MFVEDFDIFIQHMNTLRTAMMRGCAWFAHIYHFQPSEINAFTEDDVQDWMERSEYIGKQLKKK